MTCDVRYLSPHHADMTFGKKCDFSEDDLNDNAVLVEAVSTA